jgi:hypothetical protein
MNSTCLDAVGKTFGKNEEKLAVLNTKKRENRIKTV